MDEQKIYRKTFRNTLRLVGVLEKSMEKTTSHLVVDIIQKNLKVHVEERDVEGAFRIGAKSPDRSSQIVVKFINNHLKRSIYKLQVSLKQHFKIFTN